MNIGILGGSFNPVHKGHIKIAKIASESCDLKKVFFVVSNIPPHKPFPSSSQTQQNSSSSNEFLINGFHRLNMVKLAIKNIKNFFVSNFEIKRNRISYSYYTVKYFKKKFPYDKLYFIIGQDELNILHKWHKIEGIFKLTDFIVINRLEDYKIKKLENRKIGSLLLKKYSNNIHFLRIKPINISSSYIREYIWREKHIWNYVTKPVFNYIKKNLLYL